jgi:hypothetical protein
VSTTTPITVQRTRPSSHGWPRLVSSRVCRLPAAAQTRRRLSVGHRAMPAVKDGSWKNFRRG